MLGGFPTVLVLLLFLILSWAPSALAQECQPCSKEEEKAEFDRMMDAYRKAVKETRDQGAQCGDDPHYSDPGGGKHKLGNCIDWGFVAWAALRVHTWKCWDVYLIRAKKKWAFPVWYHHFVYIVPKCGGGKIFLDPSKRNTPDTYTEDVFPWADGFWSRYIHYPLLKHPAGAAPADPGKDQGKLPTE